MVSWSTVGNFFIAVGGLVAKRAEVHRLGRRHR